MISDTLAIDPGTRHLGWARGRGSRIESAGLSSVPDRIRHPQEMAEIHARAIGHGSALRAYLESMTHRPGDSRSHPQDLLDVQTVGCLVASRIAPSVVLYPPSEWKGSIPKAHHHARILTVLDPRELEIVESARRAAGSRAKEVLDAVGILLYALARTDRSGGARA